MPRLNNKSCEYPGCTAVSGARFCSAHRSERTYNRESYDKSRGTAAKRGYGARWQRLRKVILKRDPICVICRKEKRTTPSQDVDHIVPIKVYDAGLVPRDYNGGKNSRGNLQGLCRSCHTKKTLDDQRKWGGKIREKERKSRRLIDFGFVPEKP